MLSDVAELENKKNELKPSNGQQPTNNKYVYLFNEVDAAEKTVGSWENVRGLLGGKGANLGDMTRLGVPVPPGFTVTTQACNAYLDAGETFPDGMWEEVLEAVEKTEKMTGKNLWRPLKVRCWFPAVPEPNSQCPA